MISQSDIAEILPVEDSVPNDIRLASKVHPFHTDSLTYSLARIRRMRREARTTSKI